MRHQRVHPYALRLLVLSALVGCGDAADSVPANPTVAVRDACSVLAASEVEGVVGRAVRVEDLGRTTAEQWSACGYLDEAALEPDPLLEVQVHWGRGGALAEEALAGTASLQPVPGIGDGAWFSTSPGQRSLLLVGDVLVEMHTALMPNGAEAPLGGAIQRERFERLARAVVGRL